MTNRSESISRLRGLTPDEVYDTRVITERTGGIDEARDDYAVRRVPATWRWTAWDSLWAFSGISTALAFPLTGGLVAVLYGGPAALTAILLTGIYAVAGVFFMARKAASEGAVIELISKHIFGFKGAAYVIVLYGALGILYFSLEGHVMAAALSEVLPLIPYQVSAAIICLMFVPLTLYGMKFLTRFQWMTVWIYAIGMAAVVIALFTGWSADVSSTLAPHDWWNVNPNHRPYSWRTVLGAFGAIGGTFGAMLILMITSTARFTRRDQATKTGILMAFGVGSPFALTMTFGVYLLAASSGKIADPGVSIPRLLGSAGLLLVILTQLRVNVINVYFGTTALENFTSQIFQKKWTRARFLIPFMAGSYLLVISPFLQYFGAIMTMLSVFLVSWASVVLGDLWLLRPSIGLPQWTEFRRGYAASYNKIGVLSMWLPTVIGVVMASGKLGNSAQAIAVPLSGTAAFLLPKLCSLAISGSQLLRQYFARIPGSVAGLEEMHRCPLCDESFHRSDFVLCPYHKSNYVCSSCCATERHCDLCCHPKAAAI
jgi:cytosine permease